jgi:hypothetical protein
MTLARSAREGERQLDLLLREPQEYFPPLGQRGILAQVAIVLEF